MPLNPFHANASSERLIADAAGIDPRAANRLDKVIKKSFEATYQRARSADFWVDVSDFESRGRLRAFNANYGLFKAYRQHALYSPVKAKNGRSNDYFESAVIWCCEICITSLAACQAGLL